MNAYCVRKATFQDIPWISGQLKDFAKVLPEAQAVKIPSDEYISATLAEMIRNHVVLVATNEKDTPAGMIAGVINNNMMNPGVTYLTEMMWWVVPGFRREGVGKLLLKAFIACGRANESVEYITVSLEKNSPVRDNILIAEGLRHAESTFVMEAKHHANVYESSTTGGSGDDDRVVGEEPSGSSEGDEA
jgi:hypothetical protein